MRAAEAGEVTEDGLAAAAPLAIACWCVHTLNRPQMPVTPARPVCRSCMRYMGIRMLAIPRLFYSHALPVLRRGRGSMTLLVAKAEAAQLADRLRRAMHGAGGGEGAQPGAAAMEAA